MKNKPLGYGIAVSCALLGALTFVASPGFAQPRKPAPKPQPAKPPVKPATKPATPPNQTKGQGQLAGVNGQFGVIYTLQNNFNFQILNARYTVEPFLAYSPQMATPKEKLVVLQVAMKNARDKDNDFSGDSFFTLVDSKGQLYNDATWALHSKAEESFFPVLRPGQGLGQPAMNDPIEVAFKVPNDVRIVKVMINQGRLTNPEEKVFRFYVAGATKAEAGEDGDPKNVIAPLPAEVRDPSDASGVTALAEAKGKMGVALPSGAFSLKLEKFGMSSEKANGNDPEDGKTFAVATITAKFLSKGEYSFFEIAGGDFPSFRIEDADGDVYKPVAYLKASRDEAADKAFRRGDEYTFRVVFSVPKDVKMKKLVIGTGAGNLWSFTPETLKP